ncbi:Uncharacterized protein FWK35_00026599 [Aphis craccivora]|uniref:Uncharacterized protein n=1 Tax=Aphis craccivora TaxID=307492 RepID=A0A6G0YN54_APHCR|nr:Uncharacterized protein FWK35_00026599 [Aphis craccivora]
MFSKAIRFPTDSHGSEFVSPAWYYNNGILSNRNLRQNAAPFLVSSVRIANIGRSDVEISPNHYNPALYRKHRVTLGNSLQYTATRGSTTLPLRRSHYAGRAAAVKFSGPELRRCISFKNEQCQVLDDGFAFNYSRIADDKLHQVIEERLKKPKRQKKPFLLPVKLKWKTSTKSPSNPSKNDCLQNKFISIGPNVSVPELELLQWSPKNITTNYAFFGCMKTPLIEKLIARAAKKSCPGPDSYSIPLISDSATTLNLQHKLCRLQKSNKPKSVIECLDLLVANEVNIPKPEKYTGVKSLLNTIGKCSNSLDFSLNAISKRLQNDQKPAQTLYNTKYELLYKTNPKWSMKGSKRNTSFANVNTSNNIGPSTYNIKNGDIGYKIALRMENDQRHMVNCRHMQDR